MIRLRRLDVLSLMYNMLEHRRQTEMRVADDSAAFESLKKFKINASQAVTASWNAASGDDR